MPVLLWRLEFTSLKVKEEAVAHLANTSAPKEKKDGS